MPGILSLLQTPAQPPDTEASDKEEAEKQFRRYLTQPQRWNRYTYCLNNPLRRIDPDGFDPKLYVNVNIIFDEQAKALPKAVRVAQHETYALLKKHGHVDAGRGRAQAELQVGRATQDSRTQPAARPPTAEEIPETAETCVALLEMQGKKVDATLAEISSEGGWLLADDASKVRAEAEKLLREKRDSAKI